MQVLHRARKWKTLVWVLAYLLVAILIFGLIESPGIANPYSGVVAMTEFAAERPFQYRAFMPVLIRGIEAMTPASARAFCEQTFEKVTRKYAANIYADLTADRLARISGHGYRVIIYFALTFLFILGFLLVLRQLAIATLPWPNWLVTALPLGMLVVMPSFFEHGYIMYDFPHLFLVTTGLYLLKKARWKTYIAVFTLAVLNKETAFSLCAVYAVYYYSKMPQSRYIALLVAQFLLFLTVVLITRCVFRDLPGAVAQWHLLENLQVLLSGKAYFLFRGIHHCFLFPRGLGVPLPRQLNLPLFAVVAFLVAKGWRHKDPLLKATLINIPLIFPLALMFGCIFEKRAYYDLLPGLYLLSVAGLGELIEAAAQRFAKRRNRPA